MLTAETSTIADVDGLGSFGYQWLRDGIDILGATSFEYVLADIDVVSEVSVSIAYTDNGGAFESLISSPTALVTGVALAENQILDFYPYQLGSGCTAINTSQNIDGFNLEGLANNWGKWIRLLIQEALM